MVVYYTVTDWEVNSQLIIFNVTTGERFMGDKQKTNLSFYDVMESLNFWRETNTKSYWLKLEKRLKIHLHSLHQEDIDLRTEVIKDVESRMINPYLHRWYEWKAETNIKLRNCELSRKWLKYAACALISFQQKLIDLHHVTFWWDILYDKPHTVQDESIQLAIRRLAPTSKS